MARKPARLSDRSAGIIVESTAAFACVVGFDGQLEQLDARWRRELDDTAAGAAMRYIDLVHSDDRDDTLARIATLTSGQADAVEIENRFLGGNGLYRRLRWRVTAAREQRILYCLADDVSDLKMNGNGPGADSQRDLVLGATDAMAVTDADGFVTYMSPASLPLLGYAPKELIGQRMTRLIHPRDRALAVIARERAARTSDVQSISLRYRRKDGKYAWIESRSKSVIDPETGALRETQSVLRDIGSRVEAQQGIERSSLTDALTGLANRLLLADRLNQALKRLKRSPGLVGVLMLDLDHFKVINDTLGHQVGDAVLMKAAHRLERLARPDDTVARFGGDEFVVVVHGLGQPADLMRLADRIVAGLRKPYRVGREEIVTTVSIGIAATSRPDHLPADLLREADLAMYRAKDRGRDRHEVYGQALQARAVERLETERLLRRSISRRQLAVQYQPIVELATGMTVEAEALLRISDVDLGQSMPAHVLSVAEESGLLPDIDEWVRATALTQLAEWRSKRSDGAIGRVAVNVTARELVSADFATRLAATLHEAGLAGSDLAIEVTEHVLLQTSDSAMRALVELRSVGVRIGLDDFGTGYSALAHLQSFPLDFLKIDRSFVERIDVDRHSSAIVDATIQLAHALDLTVVAEGIETKDQLTRLRRFGCDRGQGFLFARPLSATRFAELLETQSAFDAERVLA